MSSLPLHPMIVHIPLALAVLMPILSLVVVGAWWRRWWPARTWLLVVLLQAVLVGGAWAAIETGEQEEERVEAVVSERLIESHEERAEIFLGGAATVLGLALLAALVPGAAAKRWVALTAVAGTFAVAFLGLRVGEAGGELVYVHGAAAAYASTRPASDDATRANDRTERAYGYHEEDDDD